MNTCHTSFSYTEREGERVGYLVSWLHRGSKLLCTGGLEGVIGQVDRAPQCQPMHAPVWDQHLKHTLVGLNKAGSKTTNLVNNTYTQTPP